MALGPPMLLLSWVVQSALPVAVVLVALWAAWLIVGVRLAWDCWQRPSLAHWLVVLALLLCLSAIARDLLAGRVDVALYDESAWNKYAGVGLALAVLVIVSLRFKQARDDLVRLNLGIGQRLADREAELAVQHARLTELARAKAAGDERAQILRDLHDGAGAHLIVAIQQLEAGRAEPAELLRTLRDSLDELRLSIDALNLPPGDVNALLSSLRWRVGRRIEAGGLKLRWRVDDLPPLDHLQAKGMRHLQAILLQAIANAIQHADAGVLTLSARTDGEDVVIELDDDGAGFDAATVRRGQGLRSIDERALLIGGEVEWLARPVGCCLRLRLPRRLPGQPEP
jgi:signal transduction histidine kinase